MAPETISFSRKVLISVATATGAVIFLYLLRQLALILLLVFAGILLAVFLDGLARWLRRNTRLPRSGALFVVILFLLLFFFGLGWVAGPILAEEFNQLAEQLPQAAQSIQERILQSDWSRHVLERFLTPAEMLSMGSGFLGQITGIFSTAFGLLTSGLVLLFIGIYLAASPKQYLDGAVRLLPRASRTRGAEILSALGLALRWWLVGRISSMVLVGILTAVGLSLIGMSQAMPLGMIAGFLSFVPYIGPAVSALPALLLALGQDGELVLYVIAVYSAVQAMESYFVTPLIQEKVVSVPPALLITSQLLMGVLFGVPGLLLSAPLTVVFLVLTQMLYQHDVLGDSHSVFSEKKVERK